MFNFLFVSPVKAVYITSSKAHCTSMGESREFQSIAASSSIFILLVSCALFLHGIQLGLVYLPVDGLANSSSTIA